MKRMIALAFAMLASGPSLADIPPPIPENPLDADCAPFAGVWAPAAPDVSRGGSRFLVLAIGSEKASAIVYLNQGDVFLEPSAVDGDLACEATADGVTILKFEGPNGIKFNLTAKLTGEASFTTVRDSSYLSAGPPPEDWKPEPITTIWTRIAK